MNRGTSTFRIQHVPPERQRAVLDNIFAQACDPEEAETTCQGFLDAVAAGQVLAIGLFELSSKEIPAERHRDPTILGYQLPGRLANVYPVVNEHTQETGGMFESARALHAALDNWLLDRGCLVAQVILPPLRAEFAAQLTQAGYRHVAELEFQSLELRATSATSDLTFLSAAQVDSGLLRATILRTYTGSKDCPEVDGLRSIDDVIDGYRHTGTYLPERWFVATKGTTPVGCLLLTEHAQQQWELMYMGVLPEFRGHGLGSKLTRFAIHHSFLQGGRQLVLAVDTRNEFARKIYHDLGLRPAVSRLVHVKRLRRIM